MFQTIVLDGQVEWSGENPGISLKEDPAGPFTTLASFFRVVLTPHGRGHALVLLLSPQDAAAPSDRPNICLTDNEPLARWLVADTSPILVPGAAWLRWKRWNTASSTTSRQPATRSLPTAETVQSGDLTVSLEWSGLGTPFCFMLAPQHSATGKHHMRACSWAAKPPPSRSMASGRAGQPIPREIAGHGISTAMLAFSETWIRV
jgi:hypothetical protein